MRELADARGFGIADLRDVSRAVVVVHERREGLEAVGAEGHRYILRLAVAETSAADSRIACVGSVGRAEAGRPRRRTLGETVQRAEAAVVQVVVLFDDDPAVGKLRLKMH